jgi:hypothetical protein
MQMCNIADLKIKTIFYFAKKLLKENSIFRKLVFQHVKQHEKQNNQNKKTNYTTYSLGL